MRYTIANESVRAEPVRVSHLAEAKALVRNELGHYFAEGAFLQPGERLIVRPLNDPVGKIRIRKQSLSA
jgi:hypothetical protein